jgi:CheY-like chemotaxis protein
VHALIIEDESLIAIMIEDVLRGCGFTTFDFAMSGEDAVALAASSCPDLITADVELNPGSGIEAVNVICSGPSIPVVFITGTPDEVTRLMPLRPLVLKPFAEETLASAVQIALANVNSEKIDAHGS